MMVYGNVRRKEKTTTRKMDSARGQLATVGDLGARSGEEFYSDLMKVISYVSIFFIKKNRHVYKILALNK